VLAYLTDPTFLAYGACAAIVLACAAYAGRPTLVKLATLLVMEWVTWNFTLAFWDFHNAPPLLIIWDAAYLTFAAAVVADALFFVDRNYVSARNLALIYLASVAAWAPFLITNTADSFYCYLVANGLYLVRLLMVGIPSAREARRAYADRHVGGLGLLHNFRFNHGHVHAPRRAPTQQKDR